VLYAIFHSRSLGPFLVFFSEKGDRRGTICTILVHRKTTRIVRIKTLYADTHVWNQLCDQEIAPRLLWETLGRTNVVPVLGFQDVYELAKTFRSGNKNERGQTLFKYLRGHLGQALPIVEDTGALLRNEARKITGEKPGKYFLEGDGYAEVIKDVDAFCVGDVKPAVTEFIEKRTAKLNSNRLGMKEHLAARPSLVATLKAVTERALPDFLNSQTRGPVATRSLQADLVHVFPQNTFEQMEGPAKRLIETGFGKVSRALIRAHIYLSWRCAERGSLRDDVYDDVFHVVNAAHCDYFATTEDRQAEYARLIIPGVSVIFADRTASILDRLVAGIR